MVAARAPSGAATSPISLRPSAVVIVIGRLTAGKTVADLIGKGTWESLVLSHELNFHYP